MLNRRLFLAAPLAAAITADAQSSAELAGQVRNAEIAFAKTMADRNFAAFQALLSDEAVFMPNEGPELRGAKAISASWQRFYTGAGAPFSWEPETVRVPDSGTLGWSSGPVRDPSGKRVGTYNSVWRREANGQWKIIFDHGCPACNCAPRG